MQIGVVRILIPVLLAASSLINPQPAFTATASQYLETRTALSRLRGLSRNDRRHQKICTT